MVLTSDERSVLMVLCGRPRSIDVIVFGVLVMDDLVLSESECLLILKALRKKKLAKTAFGIGHWWIITVKGSIVREKIK